MPKKSNVSAFKGAFSHTTSRHTIFRRQTLHCAVYQFATTGETNALNRTFNQIKSLDDAGRDHV
ncbi:MAG: hypothetical protein P1U36_09815 [Legionellaceae bacterium]|nr:hypothetical protein [Legionellaceae bacterium]